MIYRPEIDGLRAVAVLPVIFFHAGFSLFGGGFIGVDIFFVISGYLITTIIHNEIKNNSFSLKNFYERRVRRILPALFFVMLVCIPFAWFWLLPSEYIDFSQSVIAATLFSSNILFWQESGYFAPASELKPLLHTWSLAVEEQFYLFFPLLLLFVRKLNDNHLLILIITISILSLGLSEYASKYYASANFYLLPTRAWELGVGAILAITAPRWLKSSNETLNQLLSLVGLSMVLYAIFFFDETIPMPSSNGLIPVIGTALIIFSANSSNIVGKFLATKPLVGIGLISYSAYLWHYPLFAFTRINYQDEPTFGMYLFLCAGTLVLAYLTYRFIETPFRNRKLVTRQYVFTGAVTVSIAILSFGLVGHIYGKPGSNLSNKQKELLSYLKYDRSDLYRDGDCFLRPEQSYKEFKEKCFSSKVENDSILLMGDSHAAALSYGLRVHHNNFTQITASQCPPFYNYDPPERPYCKDINNFAFKKIKQLQPEMIFLHANWIYSLNRVQDKIIDLMSETITHIDKLSPNSKIVVIGGVPQWRPNLPTVLHKANIKLEEEAFVHTVGRKYVKLTDEMLLQKIVRKNNIGFISLVNIFCKNDKCLSSVKLANHHEPFAWDAAHLTKSSSILVAQKILSIMGAVEKDLIKKPKQL